MEHNAVVSFPTRYTWLATLPNDVLYRWSWALYASQPFDDGEVETSQFPAEYYGPDMVFDPSLSPELTYGGFITYSAAPTEPHA